MGLAMTTGGGRKERAHLVLGGHALVCTTLEGGAYGGGEREGKKKKKVFLDLHE